MEKIRKSILKRMRITKSGKILHSGAGTNHFQAKKSRRGQLAKKRLSDLSHVQKRMMTDYLKH